METGRDSRHSIAVWMQPLGTMNLATSEAITNITGLHFDGLENPTYLTTLREWFQFDPLQLRPLRDLSGTNLIEGPRITYMVSDKAID